MGMYEHIREAWKKPKERLPQLWKERLIKWRKDPTMKRIERPTRIDRARNLGYKSKQGFSVIRIKVRKGKRRKPKPAGGRRSKRQSNRYDPDKSKQRIAEERVSKKYPNMRVLNSYWVAEDGKQKWYEVILVDPEHPAIKKDKDINWICDPNEKDRAVRGKTASAKKARRRRPKQ